MSLRLSKRRLHVICTDLRWTPQPVIVTISDNRDYIRVLLYSYYNTITGWGGPPKILDDLGVPKFHRLCSAGPPCHGRILAQGAGY